MIYVLSDLHGEHEKFLSMLQLINFTNDDQLFVLGDVVDRGRHALEILQHIKNSPNIELLLGNHEDMMLEYYKSSAQSWFHNGGYVTYQQLQKLSAEERTDLLNYVETRPLYKVIDKYILSHSGIVIPTSIDNPSAEEILYFQSKEDLLWSREEFYLSPALSNHTVVFGHTPTPLIYRDINPGFEFGKEPAIIWHDQEYKDKIGIDCGCVFPSANGRLGCLRLDDLKEYYIG